MLQTALLVCTQILNRTVMGLTHRLSISLIDSVISKNNGTMIYV